MTFWWAYVAYTVIGLLIAEAAHLGLKKTGLQISFLDYMIGTFLWPIVLGVYFWRKLT